MVNWEYTVVWGLYLLAGYGLVSICWQLSRRIHMVVLRQVLRGSLIVLIATPWSAG